MNIHLCTTAALLVALLFAVTTEVEGQTTPDSLWQLELEEVVVGGATARRTSPATVQRIPVAQIERQDAASVADVIRLIPGAHVQTNSRGETLAYLRGAGERQVAVFFDGALLNVPWDNRVNLRLIPAGVVGTMSVAKGATSVLYGPNVMGGAMNLVPRTLDGPGHLTEAQVQYGTAGQGLGRGQHTSRTAAWAYTAAFGYATERDYALPGGFMSSFGQVSRRSRTNTDFRVLNGLLRAERDWPSGGRLAVSLLHVTGAQGVAPESHLDPADSQVRYWRYPDWQQTMAIASGRMLLGASVLHTTAWVSRFGQQIDQFESIAYETVSAQQYDDDYTAGARVIASRHLGPGLVRFTVNALATQHDQRDVECLDCRAIDWPTYTYRQYLGSIGGEYGWQPAPRVRVTVGGSWDGLHAPQTGPHDEAAFTAGDYSALAGASWVMGEKWLLRGAVGRKTRFPTLRELFGAALGKFAINPDLRPEEALQVEVGTEREGRRFSGEVVAFGSFVDRTIDQILLSDGRRQRVNREGSRVVGVEASGVWQPLQGTTVQGNLTAMSVRGYAADGEASLRIAEKPEVLARFAAFNTPARGPVYYAESVYTGVAFSPDVADRWIRLAPSLVLNVKIGYRFYTARWDSLFAEVYARVDNATDAVVVPQAGLPAPGREFAVGLKVTV